MFQLHRNLAAQVARQSLHFLLPSPFWHLVIILPNFFINPSHRVVVGRWPMKLVIFPDSNPFVSIGKVENSISIFHSISKISHVAVVVGPDVLPPSLPFALHVRLPCVSPSLS